MEGPYGAAQQNHFARVYKAGKATVLPWAISLCAQASIQEGISK